MPYSVARAARIRPPRERRKIGMTAFSKMDADGYREHLEALGLNQVTAAEFLGIDPRTSRRYALGEPIPRIIALALSVMVQHRERSRNR
jgi:hypothetical protein